MNTCILHSIICSKTTICHHFSLRCGEVGPLICFLHRRLRKLSHVRRVPASSRILSALSASVGITQRVVLSSDGTTFCKQSGETRLQLAAVDFPRKDDPACRLMTHLLSLLRRHCSVVAVHEHYVQPFASHTAYSPSLMWHMQDLIGQLYTCQFKWVSMWVSLEKGITQRVQ